MLDWGHFGGVHGGRKDRYRVAKLSQLSLVDVEIAICSVVLFILYRENGSGHIERADYRCDSRVLDWKQKGGVPRIVSMRGGLSGRNTKVRNAE
jgi:hypothetical protein